MGIGYQKCTKCALSAEYLLQSGYHHGLSEGGSDFSVTGGFTGLWAFLPSRSESAGAQGPDLPWACGRLRSQRSCPCGAGLHPPPGGASPSDRGGRAGSSVGEGKHRVLRWCLNPHLPWSVSRLTGAEVGTAVFGLGDRGTSSEECSEYACCCRWKGSRAKPGLLVLTDNVVTVLLAFVVLSFLRCHFGVLSSKFWAFDNAFKFSFSTDESCATMRQNTVVLILLQSVTLPAQFYQYYFHPIPFSEQIKTLICSWCKADVLWDKWCSFLVMLLLFHLCSCRFILIWCSSEYMYDWHACMSRSKLPGDLFWPCCFRVLKTPCLATANSLCN